MRSLEIQSALRSRLRTTATIFGFASLLSACASQRADAVAASAPGFLLGLWHGFIFPVAWVISLFIDNAAVYAVPNNGGWYDFGYFLGIVVFGVGARKTRTVYRTRVVRAGPAPPERETVIIDQ